MEKENGGTIQTDDLYKIFTDTSNSQLEEQFLQSKRKFINAKVKMNDLMFYLERK